MRNFLKVKFSNASITFMVFFFSLLLAQTETMVKLPGQNKEKSYKKYLENLCSDQRRNHCCQRNHCCDPVLAEVIARIAITAMTTQHYYNKGLLDVS